MFNELAIKQFKTMDQFKAHTGLWPLTFALKYRNIRQTKRSKSV